MSQVTRLEVQKKNKLRVNLYLDDEFFCGLDAVTALSNHLEVGVNVDETKLYDVLMASESSSAFTRSIDYLSRTMKTEKQMRTYLLGKGYAEQVVDIVVCKLKDYCYIDDAMYAQLYVEQNVKNKGTKRIKLELAKKGIDKEQTNEITDNIDDDVLLDSAKLLADKYMRNKETTRENLIRLQRYLYGRGYDYDLINSITHT
ncbi:MAG: RecX family transcriptional regulator, partial [Clostridia bacterium]